MILVDANLLLYAYNPRAAQYDTSRRWLNTALNGSDLVRFGWMTVWAFLRISTNRRIFEHPLTSSEAVGAVSSWFDRPNVGILEPGERHWAIFMSLLEEGQALGPMVMDAALAALAIEHGATLHTADRGFARFGRLKFTNPIAEH